MAQVLPAKPRNHQRIERHNSICSLLLTRCVSQLTLVFLGEMEPTSNMLKPTCMTEPRTRRIFRANHRVVVHSHGRAITMEFGMFHGKPKTDENGSVRRAYQGGGFKATRNGRDNMLVYPGTLMYACAAQSNRARLRADKIDRKSGKLGDAKERLGDRRRNFAMCNFWLVLS